MGNVFSCSVLPFRHRGRNYDILQSANQSDGVQDVDSGPAAEPMVQGVSFTVQELPGATNTGLIRDLSPLGFQPLDVEADTEVTRTPSTAKTADDITSDNEHEDETLDSKHVETNDGTNADANASAVQDISEKASIKNELVDTGLADSGNDKGKVEECPPKRRHKQHMCRDFEN